MTFDMVQLPSDWKVVKLHEIAHVADVDHKMPKGVDIGIAFISAKDITEEGLLNFSSVKEISRDDFEQLSKKIRPRIGDIIYTRIGSVGRAAIVTDEHPREFQISYSCCVIRLYSNDYDREHLYHLIRSPIILNQARIGTQSIGVPDLGLGVIRRFRIPKPPLSEQRKIAEILSDVDRNILKCRSSIESAQDLKNGLMQYLLTRGIGHTKFKKTKVGEIPEKWNIKSLGDVCNVVSGSAFPIKYQGKQDGEYPLYKVSDMNLEGNEKFMRGANNTVGRHELDAMNAKVYPTNTVIFPKLGAALLTNKRRILTRDSAFDNNIMGLVPKAIHPAYLYSFMQTVDFARYVQMGAVPSIRLSAVKSMRIQVPPQEEQAKIASILSELDMLMNDELVNSRHLEYLKKGLMQVLLTGKVRVGA